MVFIYLVQHHLNLSTKSTSSSLSIVINNLDINAPDETVKEVEPYYFISEDK